MVDETSSRADVLKAVKKNGLALKHASHELQQDLQIVGAAVKNNHAAMKYVAEEVLSDFANAFWLLESNYLAYIHFKAEWRDDEQISIAAFTACAAFSEPKRKEAFKHLFQYIPTRLINSTAFYLQSLSFIYIDSLPHDIRWSKPFILACYKSQQYNFYITNDAPANFILDDDFVIEMLKTKEFTALVFLMRHSPGGRKLSPEYDLLQKIIDSAEVFKTCDKRDSKEFVKKALKANPLVFDYLSTAEKHDPELLKLASEEDRALLLVEKDPDEFFKLDASLQANPKILGKVVKLFRLNKEAFFAKINPKLWEDPKNVGIVMAIAGVDKLPAEVGYSVEVYKEYIKLARNFVFQLSLDEIHFSAKDFKEINLCRIEYYPNNFKYLDKKFRTNKEFMQKTHAIPAAKPFVDKFLEDHHLTIDQLILEEEQTEAIKASVDRAQRLYAAWYKPKTKETLESTRSKPGYSGFKLSSLTWFRHGQKGQERATDLKKAIASKDEWQIWQAIQALLAKAPYHEHSFASFLIDELKKLESSPFANISFSKENHNRYSKKEVMFALKNFLKIRDPNFEKITLEPDSKFAHI